MKEELTPKQQEVKMLDDLMALNGYFADDFKNSVEKMKMNIKNDFPILLDTEVGSWKFRAEQSERELETYKRALKDTNDTLMSRESQWHDLKEEEWEFAYRVLDRASKIGDSELEELCCTILGRDFAIAHKLKHDIPLSEADKGFLVKELDPAGNSR